MGSLCLFRVRGVGSIGLWHPCPLLPCVLCADRGNARTHHDCARRSSRCCASSAPPRMRARARPSVGLRARAQAPWRRVRMLGRVRGEPRVAASVVVVLVLGFGALCALRKGLALCLDGHGLPAAPSATLMPGTARAGREAPRAGARVMPRTRACGGAGRRARSRARRRAYVLGSEGGSSCLPTAHLHVGHCLVGSAVGWRGGCCRRTRGLFGGVGRAARASAWAEGGRLGLQKQAADAVRVRGALELEGGARSVVEQASAPVVGG
jgi:hypothetical protein